MFREPIDQITSCVCPPQGAITSTITGYRLVKSIPPSINDFDSHMALGKTKPKDIDECSWISCSLFKKPEQLFGINGLPKVKGSWAGIAEVSLSPSSGPFTSSQHSGHINWWPVASFNILGSISIVKVFP